MSGLSMLERDHALMPTGSISFLSALQMVCSLSSALLQAPESRLGDALQTGLSKVGEFLHLDNAYLYLYSESGDRVEKTFEWTTPGQGSQRKHLSGMRLCSFLYTKRMIEAKRQMILGSIEELPHGAKSERLLWHVTGTKALLGNPLYVQGVLIGYFGLASRRNPRIWTGEEVEFSRLLAEIFANALSRFCSEKRLRQAQENELSIAVEIQRSLLSPAPVPSKFPVGIGICSHPSLSVDGDFIDFFQNPDGSIDLIMGDSMGKGVTAALLSAATKIAILRARAESGSSADPAKESPGEILQRVEEEMGEKLGEVSAFVTLAFVRFDPKQHSLLLLNAGHPPVLIWRQNKARVDSFDSKNPPIGIPSQHEIEYQQTHVESGDVILMYSDGLIDARNKAGQFFGIQQIKDILQSTHYLPPQEIADRIYRLCLAYIGKDQFQDDFSCMVISIP